MFVPLTPVRILQRAIELFPNQPGVVSGDLEFTYGEFGKRAGRLASALTRAGIGPGDRVAYLSFNTHQLIEGYFGVPQMRGVVMPLNVRLSPVEFVAILNHSGARVLLYELEFAPLVDKLREQCPSIERYISLDQQYEDFLATGTDEPADIMAIDEMSTAELFYTSGSTGTPKGVALSHRTLYLHALSVALLYRDTDTMVDLHTIPLFHANGWGHPHASTLLGVKQVMVRRFEPVGVCKLIEKHRATDMSLVPTMANALLACPETANYDLSSLRMIMIGGAASSPELIARMENKFHCNVYAGYGLTETAPVITCARAKPTLALKSDAERHRYAAMAGWPVPGVEVRVVDAEMNDVPQDGQSIGEVVARGDQIMSGYFAEPAATEAVMTGGWFHTGDMAVWDPENYIHIVDRKKEIIISGGENISSLEVERAIFAHPDVFECAVVAAPDDKWGEVPVAIVMRKPGSAMTEQDLCVFLEGRLGKFKMPRRIEFTEEALPKTGTGKIRKNILRERYWHGKEKRVQG